MSFKEKLYKSRDGVDLHVRKYTEEYKPPSSKKKLKPVTFKILCAHGWMDNVNTWNKYVPALMKALCKKGGPDTPVKIELLAFDFPGHGKSGHKSLDGQPQVNVDYVYYVYDLIHGELRWEKEKVILIGHSLGATIAMQYAAVWPVHRIVMLDAMGPESNLTVITGMKQHIEQRFYGKPRGGVYKSFDDVVKSRIATVEEKKSFSGGKQYISYEAASEIMKGTTKELDDGRFELSHDARIKWRFALFMTQDQKDEIYASVAKACVDEYSDELFGAEESEALQIMMIMAEDGTFFTPEEVSHFKKKVQPERFVRIPGSHHFHLDEKSYEKVVKLSSQFLLGN